MVQSYVELDTPAGSRLVGGANGELSLASLMPGDMSEAYPAVDATNGPLTADSHLVQSAAMPAPSGKTLYRWDSGVFRLQGMKWEAANGGANKSGQSAAINNSTSRKYTYGDSTGSPYESNHDFAFLTDSLTVQIVYWHWTGYTGSNYHDARFFVEHQGRMKSIRDSAGTTLPKTSTAGAGFYSETLTFKEARERQVRVMLPANCFVVGVFIDATATIRKAPNVLWFAHRGDSWGESNRAAGSIDGAGFPAGKYITMNLIQEAAVASGAVWTWTGQGGTGEFNANDGAARALDYVTGANESVFHGEAALADLYTKFGGIPIVTHIGGWNDNDLAGTAATARVNYRDRTNAGIGKHRTKAAAVGKVAKLIYVSIQPVDQSGTGGTGTHNAVRAASLLGQKDAATDPVNAANVLGFVDLTPMWVNMSMAGQRGANVKTDDTIHLNCKGAELVARWILAAIRQMTIPASNYNDMIKAA